MDSDTEADANSEACLLEVDSDVLVEIDALDSDRLVDTEAETLVDSEVNSDVCLLEADSEVLAETDVEFKTDSELLTDAD